jgi:hypothetical protein
VNKPEAISSAGIPKGFRRLKWNEVVSRGDFVVGDDLEFEPWEGPRGFQADSFLKPIYRAAKAVCPKLKKSP